MSAPSIQIRPPPNSTRAPENIALFYAFSLLAALHVHPIGGVSPPSQIAPPLLVASIAMPLLAFATSFNLLLTTQRQKHLRKPQSTVSACNQSQWDAGTTHLLSIAHKFPVSQSPHSRSHFVRRPRSSSKPFFEGWYLRAVLPKTSESFAFMFSVEANTSGTFGTVQVAGPDDKNYIHQLRGGPTGFCASSKLLEMCHWGDASALAGPPRFLGQSEFERHVTSGYQLSETQCVGRIPVGSSGSIQWGFDFMPNISWGERDQKSRCTATWISRFPVFEPGYQILMAHGIATAGIVRYCGKAYGMEGARVYAEKNWGASFPSKWWWMQANAFQANQDLSVTAVGAKRMILAWEETIGMIAIHLDGSLYEFSNWNSTMAWDVVWGRWEARAKSKSGYEALVSGTTTEEGVIVLGPTALGMAPNVRDAMHGAMTLTLRAPDGSFLLDRETCVTAQVEVGGAPWAAGTPWTAEVPMLRQPLRGTVNLFNGKRVLTSA